MSLAGDRSELAGILSTVEGVTGFKYRPTGLRTGHAWSLITRLERGPGNVFYAPSWRVMVVLPSQEDKASEWFDNHHEAIAEALEDFGYVESIEMGQMNSSDGDIFVIEFTLGREA